MLKCWVWLHTLRILALRNPVDARGSLASHPNLSEEFKIKVADDLTHEVDL